MIDISKPGFMSLLEGSQPSRERRGMEGFRAYEVRWGNTHESLNLTLYNSSIPGEGESTLGLYTYGVGISIQRNAEHCRGGIEGTIAHEFAHHLQWWGSENSMGGWSLNTHNDFQTDLWVRWRPHFEGTYAFKAPAEAGAEVFRVLMGWKGQDAWEGNQALLEEWRAWFTQNAVFGPCFK